MVDTLFVGHVLHKFDATVQSGTVANEVEGKKCGVGEREHHLSEDFSDGSVVSEVWVDEFCEPLEVVVNCVVDGEFEDALFTCVERVAEVHGRYAESVVERHVVGTFAEHLVVGFLFFAKFLLRCFSSPRRRTDSPCRPDP